MKAIKLLFAAIFMAASTTAFAQFTSNVSRSAYNAENVDSYSRVEVGFTLGTPKFSSEGISVEGDNMNGITAGLIWGKNISTTMPLYTEYGAKATWLNWSSGETKENYIYISIPVNLVYKYAINEEIALSPFAGLNAKVNILAKEKDKDVSYNLFEDFDGEDGWSRFQIGANLGVGLTIKNLNLIYTFQPDFMELSSYFKIPTHTFSISFYL